MTRLLGFLQIFIIHFLIQAQAQEGIDPIPANELYGEPFNVVDVAAPECNPKNYKSASDYETCWKSSIYHTDYGCRYHKMFRPQCHCCGKYYHYIEHGPICTKFCLNEDGVEYGQTKILITLPFNWGWDVPDKITLEDGTELPVKCDILDGNNFGCNGDSNGGNRNGLPTIQLASNKPKENKEKFKITTTTRPLRKRTTTISNRPKIEEYKRTTLKTTTVPNTFQARVQTKSTRTTRRTTTKRTMINPIVAVGVRVPYSFGREKTTELPRIFDARTERKFFKTTTTSFGAKLTTRQRSTDEHIWIVRKNEPRVPKATTLVGDRPVWG